MKKTHYTLLLAFSAFFILLVGCKKPDPVVPTADKVKRSYTASSVSEGPSVVYSSTGSTSSKPNYSQFLLDLSSPPTVRYRTFDGILFTGTYTVTDSQITLNNLTSPSGPPTGTGGMIVFNISELGDGTTPTLTRITPDQKTGNTLNVYKLKTP